MRNVFYGLCSALLIMFMIALYVIPGSEAYEPYLMEEVIINNTTYVVVNYNFLDGTFTLDNGIEVRKEVVYQLVKTK